MKVGLDSFSLHPLKLGPLEQLAWASDHDFDGVQFGYLGDDDGVWREIQQEADRRNLYSHISVRSPNRHLRDLSADQVVARISEDVQRAAACGWHELHVTMGDQHTRYEHAIPWPTQLAAAIDVVNRLAPVLRDHQSRLNFEPHGDVTTFELVRLVESTGSDIAGVCLDTANVLVSAEDPLAAARRVASYTHLTHAKDGIIYLFEKGIQRQGRPPGKGCIDWHALLRILGEFSPDLPLSIEDHKWFFSADLFEPTWHEQNPDLPRREMADMVALAWRTSQRIREGDLPLPEAYEATPYAEEMTTRLLAGRDHLRLVTRQLGL